MTSTSQIIMPPENNQTKVGPFSSSTTLAKLPAVRAGAKIFPTWEAPLVSQLPGKWENTAHSASSAELLGS